MHLAVFRIQKWSNCESRLFIANWKDKTIRKKIGLGFLSRFLRKNSTVQMEEPYIVITPTYGEQVANFFL